MQHTGLTHERLPTEAARIAAGVQVLDLLRRAGDALGRDRAASRRYVSSALALLDDDADPFDVEAPCIGGSALSSGGLSVWQQRKVTSYIATNIRGPLAVGSLAALARLSPSYFCKAFKATFGMPPHAYVMNERVAQACTAMASTSAPLSEIAVDLGFSDQAHLCRAFRRIVGDTPARWRKLHRGEPRHSEAF